MSFIQCSQNCELSSCVNFLGTCAWLIGAKLASLMRGHHFSPKFLEPASSHPLGFSMRLTITLHDSCSLLKHRPAISLFLRVSCNRQRSILKPLPSYQNSPAPPGQSQRSYNTLLALFPIQGRSSPVSALNSLIYKSNSLSKGSDRSLFCPPR